MEPNLICPKCKTTTASTSFFCPNCGRQLRKKPISTSIGKQIYIYAISLLLPPLGLWWGVPLLFQKDTKSKIVGIVSILLTIISLVVSVKLFTDFMQGYSEQLNSINSLY